MWFLLGALLVGLAVLLLRKQPQQRIEADNVRNPKSKQGDEIGRLYGTGWIVNPNLVWWGGIKIRAIFKSTGGKK